MDNPEVLLATELGEITLEPLPRQAPLTAANFLHHVDEGRYTEASLYRAVRPDNQARSPVKIEVIQGGLGMVQHPLKLPPIPHETTEVTGAHHLEGTVSMSRLEPGTAHSWFRALQRSFHRDSLQ